MTFPDYHQKPKFKTEKRVTRSQARDDPSLAPRPRDPSPKSTFKAKTKRQYNKPWFAIVLMEVETRDPTIKRAAARKEAKRIIKNASEEDRARWRKQARLPGKN
ncbi:unnamed protein product [Caenorhabditis brenneri]